MAGDTPQDGFCWIEEHFEGSGGGAEKGIENENEDRKKEGRYLDVKGWG